MPFTITRRQFYELLWSEPATSLRSCLGVSDVAIGKAARKANIPLPGVGHWAKVAAGATVERSALPPPDLATPPTIEFRTELTDVLRQRLSDELGVAADPEEEIEVLASRLRTRLGDFRLPRSFVRAHPAVKQLLDRDERIRVKRARGQSWQDPLFETEDNRRKLRVANGLLLAAVEMGGSGSAQVSDGLRFYVHIADFAVPIRFSQTSAGKLTAFAEHMEQVGSPASWSDREDGRLEDRIVEIFVDAAILVERWRRHYAVEQERRRQHDQQEAVRKKREEREAARLAVIDKLEVAASAYRKAEDIRAYVIAALASSPDADTQRWADWARTIADSIDPITSGQVSTAVPDNNDHDG